MPETIARRQARTARPALPGDATPPARRGIEHVAYCDACNELLAADPETTAVSHVTCRTVAELLWECAACESYTLVDDDRTACTWCGRQMIRCPACGCDTAEDTGYGGYRCHAKRCGAEGELWQ